MLRANVFPTFWDFSIQDYLFSYFTESLVDLRHDMTHGEMRSKDSLLEGLAKALQWTIRNYWQCEEESNKNLCLEGRLLQTHVISC